MPCLGLHFEKQTCEERSPNLHRASLMPWELRIITLMWATGASAPKVPVLPFL